MSSLQAIGFTLAGGVSVMTLSFIGFGTAIRFRSVYVAPRCTARPPETIYNPNPACKSQDRGNPMFGWISWCSGLTYETLIKGVPGTGTRKGGLEGDLLKVNLDGIVLLRFIALCTRVTGLIMCLCLFIILPINLTARCQSSSDDFGGKSGCFNDAYNLTDYSVTTLANIPEPTPSDATSTVFEQNERDIFGRLYAIVLCFWFICYYACKRMQHEWITMLALRRHYYFETDIYRERKEELLNTVHRDYDSDDEETALNAHARDPWIPHPEQRETVPNIALYSVLVGGIPAAPDDDKHIEDVEEAIKATRRRTKIDWQLSYVGEYFDRCVPNQPGYSSSVAAITILPSAPHIARAWSKWYAAAGKLRRLRFIRKLINDKLHYEIDVDEDEEEGDDDDDTKRLENLSHRNRNKNNQKDQNHRNKEYYRDVLGATDEEIAGTFLSDSFSPEQTAAYSREFHQSAAACCPNGCCEGRLRRARIDDLRELEDDAILEVHAANTALKKAQRRVVKFMESDDSTHLFSIHRQPDEDDEEEAEDSEEEKVKGFFHQSSMENIIGMIDSNAKLRRRGRETSWSRVESMVNEAAHHTNRSTRAPRMAKAQKVGTGEWKLPSFFGWSKKKANLVVGEVVGQGQELTKDIGSTVADHLLRESTYAVVTFTSRQAAVAARQCLADGRGLNRWTTWKRLPIPPLADAAPCSLCPCRGCCRPVTLTIHNRQKVIRNYIAMALLGTIYVTYTVPLLLATTLVDPERLSSYDSRIEDFLDRYVFFNRALSGLLPAIIWSTFFGLCPVMFKSIANFGSNAASVYLAEYTAMQYYWYFMVVTAFTNNLLWQMLLRAINTGLNLGSDFADVVRTVAATVPTVISATWLNWCILRTTMILPMQYMLQFNTFLFAALGWKCCSRMVRGGGPGGPVPYRIYIDSGVVFLCSVALAPAAPLVAPVTFMYFFFGAPLLKRNLIFMYRPKYDAGGRHWPFLFDMMISSLVVGEILMVTMMALRRAVGPAVLASIPIVPTIMFRLAMRSRYLQAYRDTSLYHASDLDGWDVHDDTSMEIRSDFRKFLVDAHKAAYVPVCLARSEEVLTVEPALVVPHERDPIDPQRSVRSAYSVRSSTLSHDSAKSKESSTRLTLASTRRSSQFGVSIRRILPTRASLIHMENFVISESDDDESKVNDEDDDEDPGEEEINKSVHEN